MTAWAHELKLLRARLKAEVVVERQRHSIYHISAGHNPHPILALSSEPQFRQERQFFCDTAEDSRANAQVSIAHLTI